MRYFRLRRTIRAEGGYGTGEWEVSPWWSHYFPLVYKSRRFYFACGRWEMPVTSYRVRNGKMVVSRAMTSYPYWNGWLVALWRAIGSFLNRATAKIKAITHKHNTEEIPF